jgi:hypothetical protein
MASGTKRLGPLAAMLAAFIALALTGPAAAGAAVTGSALDFGEVEVGTFSESQLLTLGNDGHQSFVIQEVEIGGAQDGDFDIADTNCYGVRLYPGQSCQVELRAWPHDLGVRRGTVLVFLSGRSTPYSFALTTVGRETGGPGSDPSNPGNPSNPSSPGSPSNPGGPSNPSKPSNPTDPVEARKKGLPPRFHMRAGLLTLGRGGRVAVATVSCPRASKGSCRLVFEQAYLTSLGPRRLLRVLAPGRLAAGSWARIFVVIPGNRRQQLAAVRGRARLSVYLSGRGRAGAFSSASLSRRVVG